MRHEQILARDGINELDIAAVWPVTAQLAPFPLPDIAGPGVRHLQIATQAMPDMPAAVGKFVVIAYAALIATLAFTAAGTRESNFMIAIAALFVVMFFSVPRIFLAVEPKDGIRPSFNQFMANGTKTLTGHNSAKAALVQILILPVALSVAVLAMGIAAAIIL
ncbi:MAG: hypothetical protein LH465_02990 [Sphingomonas bacterium]|nr:hypothetical protein [Sphingomonas bacterium]